MSFKHIVQLLSLSRPGALFADRYILISSVEHPHPALFYCEAYRHICHMSFYVCLQVLKFNGFAL